MNLHAAAMGSIAAINPLVNVTVQFSTGDAVAADGKPVPSYAAPVGMQAQIQPLTARDLRQMDGINLNGTERAIYLSGALNGVVRVSGKGGDLIAFPDGSIYLTTLVLEQWPDWVKVVATLQNGA